LGKLGRKKKMKIYTNIESPLGQVLLVSDGTSLTGVYFSGQKYEPTPGPDWRRDPDLKILKKSGLQLLEYFAGDRGAFHLPVSLQGTPFQIKVWNAISEIPLGETKTYGELAKRINRTTAVRAVGAAVGRNPLTVIVPCHRVIGRDGSLTGYAGGLERKRALLSLEAAMLGGHHQEGLLQG
jgi:methylated-DNA-[protein]-cysteine S-methyltransferase